MLAAALVAFGIVCVVPSFDTAIYISSPLGLVYIIVCAVCAFRGVAGGGKDPTTSLAYYAGTSVRDCFQSLALRPLVYDGDAHGASAIATCTLPAGV
jgi:hypothetical protein